MGGLKPKDKVEVQSPPHLYVQFGAEELPGVPAGVQEDDRDLWE